jgi:2-hydroxymuconate-semialdehyde hydrolase
MPLINRDFEFRGIRVNVTEGGEGFPVLMFHGSGPGASTAGNWRRVLEPLAGRYHIYAMDLIGFGQSGRKPAPPYFDLELWLDQCQAMIDRVPGDEIGIIAHSLSGALSFRLVGRNPRVGKLLTTGTIGAPFTVNEQAVKVWTFPDTRDDLRATAEILIYDKSVIDDAYIRTREKILFEDESYRAYFQAMFAGARQRFADAAVLSAEDLARVTCAVTMMHGREDIAFPATQTLSIAERIPQANVMLLARCSHSIAMEYPEKLLAAAEQLFG